jgi:hypothetical protein
VSYVSVEPEKLWAAAGNLQSIAAALSAGNAVAAGPTTARAVAIHELLAATLASGAGSRAATEAANAAASAL